MQISSSDYKFAIFIQTKQVQDKSAMCSRIKWTIQEEEFLRFLRENQKMESWKEIAEQVNGRFCKQEKTGKQCRERYINYVRFGAESSVCAQWTPRDDKKFTNLYLRYGPKWCLIVQEMTNKSENLLKNRFYGGLRRIIKKINKVEKGLRVRKTKPIRYETLIRILDYECQSEGMNQIERGMGEQFRCFASELKVKILKATWDLLNGDESEDKIMSLIEEIHLWNTEIKNISSMRRAKGKLTRISGELVGIFQNSVSTVVINEAENSLISSNVEEKTSKSSDTIEIFSGEVKQEGHHNKNEDFELPEYNLDLSKLIEKPISYDLDKEFCQILQQKYVCPAFDFDI